MVWAAFAGNLLSKDKGLLYDWRKIPQLSFADVAAS
jgi:hypothetical protein